jgi:tetratricopeptide (TPR) repeat protein
MMVYFGSFRLTFCLNRRQQSAAYCAIAELYLTDLCYEDDAEQECETAIQAALKIIDPTDGEPLVDSLQTMASLRLSQRRAQEATKFVLEAYEKMRCGCEALSALVGLQKNDEASTQAVELVDVDAANNLPSFEFRCQSAKILLECAAALKEENNEASKAPQQSVQCSDAAIQVLGSLLAENDEVIEVWYLMGCAFEAASDLDAAAQYWERTLDMLLKVKESLEMSSDDDEEQDELQDVNVQIEGIRKKLEETGREVDAMETEEVNMDT